MRRRTLMLVCAAAVVAMPARLRAQAHSAPLQAWVEAFNSRDPKRIVAIYAPDAVLWGTTARTIATTSESIWLIVDHHSSRVPEP